MYVWKWTYSVNMRDGGGLLSIYMLWNNNIQWFGITCIILVYNYFIGSKCFHRNLHTSRKIIKNLKCCLVNYSCIYIINK